MTVIREIYVLDSSGTLINPATKEQITQFQEVVSSGVPTLVVSPVRLGKINVGTPPLHLK
jgi:dethiobiotin synthetase